MHHKKIIVLGLTGPVGSGCTQFSKIFDDDEGNHDRLIGKNKLFAFLKEKNHIDFDNSGLIVKYGGIDEEIKSLFKKLDLLDKKIGEINSTLDSNEKAWFQNNIITEDVVNPQGSLELHHYTDLKRKTFNRLKQKLEVRETLKCLDELRSFIDIKKGVHLFRRISISDLIIFNTLIYKDNPIRKIKKENREKVDKYLKILDNAEVSAETDNILKNIREIIPKARNLGAIKKLLDIDKDYDDEIITQILRSIVKLIRNIKNKIKKEKDIYRTIMQDFGDNIRRSGNPFDYRVIEDYSDNLKNNIHLTLAKDVETLINFLHNKREHSFFIIDSFRNPYEALYFEKKYPSFYLISLYAPQRCRQNRLRDRYDNIGEERDQGKQISNTEDYFYMQNVPQTVKFSDIAINNYKEDCECQNMPASQLSPGEYRDECILNNNDLIAKTIRYLALIFDAGCTKPTDDEVMMNLAYTMAMKSNCICRQVGAVIEGRDGYIVGAGWNDVGEGKISCGLREIKDLKLERYTNYLKVLKEKDIIDKLIHPYKHSKLKREELERFCFCFKDEYSRITNQSQRTAGKLMQYCEALHAEENAIIQSSKIGGMGLMGGKIYTTSFPCELCAKKIQQVGLSEVIYTEPYPGSISEDIYLENAFSKIKVRQFEGVMPHKYFKLFKVVDDQKDWQKMYSKNLIPLTD